ncbi:hypothetical protein T492DRAFT_919628 [Pavlovales sp. CCMP2436]|nr:hypothetical protein T492DRAFT_919628 [Pavlovales sp. CCMP2436]|mmetsp:Transcript_33579/g.79034  ORF Transcript_33579/g.79034 Transcript_33579/m.79034 type:complete len:138 (+) Transcript_33579:60-473(+)
MSGPFFVGAGVAVGCWVLRAGVQLAPKVAPNMPKMPSMGAAAPNWNAAAAAAQKLYQDAISRVAGAHPGGFEKAMTRREAGLILGVKESAQKDELKMAHRNMMLLNHPDKGGSPFIASKINEALEALSNRAKRSSAF